MNANDRIAEIDAEIERLKAERRSLKLIFIDGKRLYEVDAERHFSLIPHISYLARAAVSMPERKKRGGYDCCASPVQYEKLSLKQKRAAKALADRIIDLYEEVHNSKPWEAEENNEGGTHDE